MTDKFKHPLLLLLALVLVLPACKRANDNNPALIGKWQGKEWLVFGKPMGQDASLVFFEFTTDGDYSAQFGDQEESGVWRTQKDKLYTTAQGEKEIVVKILTLNETTLRFEMNRGGQQETLELTKTQ
ncbi:MAG: lipocalin family protein [Lewinellaceae bacterium]|nr:lipocalin family protein [Lewinellaceae bacterium]